jgi:hypothetical protein
VSGLSREDLGKAFGYHAGIVKRTGERPFLTNTFEHKFHFLNKRSTAISDNITQHLGSSHNDKGAQDLPPSSTYLLSGRMRRIDRSQASQASYASLGL